MGAVGATDERGFVVIPFLDLSAHHAPLEAEMRAATDRVLASGRFILGPEVEALETEVAELCGVGDGIGVSSGTDALLVCLMALGIGPGDEVVTSAYSFFATAGAVARLGAIPAFADIDPETFNLDAAAAAGRVGPRTRAVVPVHLFGRVAEVDALLETAERREVPVVEDAAQAIGARDPAGRHAGSLGLAGCFSFYPTKNVGALGDAGMVVTRDAELAARIRTLREHGTGRKYRHEVVGGNFRLDAIQAALLRVKLAYLARWTAARRRNAERYRALFAAAGLEERVRLPTDAPGHTYHQYVIRASERDALRAHLAGSGVETRIYYPVPLHLQPCFRELGYPEGSLPHAERAAAESLALPMYPELTEDQQVRIVEQIAAFYLGRPVGGEGRTPPAA